MSYTLAKSRGNYVGQRRAGERLPGRLTTCTSICNEGPTDFDNRHNFTVSGTALVPHTGGLNVSWVARALSGRPFSLTNGNVDPDLNGIQAEPLPAGNYAGVGTNAFTVENYKAERNGAYGPGFFGLDMRFGYSIRVGGTAPSRAVRRHLQPDQPHELRQPDRQPGVGAVPAAHRRTAPATRRAKRRSACGSSSSSERPAIAAGLRCAGRDSFPPCVFSWC